MEALRHQRHRFQNHLQVISGWLQLGKPERASAYLATLRQSREQEGKLFALSDWRLLALLLEKHALAEANAVPVAWDVASPLDGASPELSAWLRSRFDAALDLCMARGSGARLEIELRNVGGEHAVRIAAFGPDGELLTGGADWQQTFRPEFGADVPEDGAAGPEDDGAARPEPSREL